MKHLMQIIARALPGEAPYPRATYLKSMDWEADRGRGRAELTESQDEAMTFDSRKDVFLFWRRQSEVQPLRPDGLPNKPLTAYTINIIEKGKRPLGY